LRDLCDDLKRREITVVFGRVNAYLRADMGRHGITSTIGEKYIFSTLHEALAEVRGND
jgi:sulfate permease, SulP family